MYPTRRLWFTHHIIIYLYTYYYNVILGILNSRFGRFEFSMAWSKNVCIYIGYKLTVQETIKIITSDRHCLFFDYFKWCLKYYKNNPYTHG